QSCSVTPRQSQVTADTRINGMTGERQTTALTRKDQSLLIQLMKCCLVRFLASALFEHFFVPMQTKGVQCVQDPVSGFGYFARGIDVFDADEPQPPVSFGVQIAGECCC